MPIKLQVTLALVQPLWTMMTIPSALTFSLIWMLRFAVAAVQGRATRLPSVQPILKTQMVAVQGIFNPS